MQPELELATDATSKRERMIGNLIILIIKVRQMRLIKYGE